MSDESNTEVLASAARVASQLAIDTANIAHKVSEIAIETARKVAEVQAKNSESLAVLSTDLSWIKSTMIESKNEMKIIRELLENKYVTKDVFEMTRIIVYGALAIVGTAAGAAFFKK